MNGVSFLNIELMLLTLFVMGDTLEFYKRRGGFDVTEKFAGRKNGGKY